MCPLQGIQVPVVFITSLLHGNVRQWRPRNAEVDPEPNHRLRVSRTRNRGPKELLELFYRCTGCVRMS